ncbi:bacterial Ig-like domain-containing protein [Bacillus sp. S3]|uniref:bacterial Ig-like domain-containing protein n=1 Tax=Bacillus sp. S3 TaxID=486398 RepID=UPI002958AB96|nr:bacterial Ig-like domain-containing protein [Bacillus sp. S3]
MSVKNTTIYAEKELDLKSLITFAENSKGKDVTDKVIIDAGDFDPTTPGDYTITFTLKEDGFKDVVHTATVTVELKPSNWYSGKGAPKDSVGKKGDFYLDVTTDELYQKGEEGWKLIGSFNENESKGTTWLVGKGQPDANVGKAGDLYLDTTTGDVYNKEKETKEWKLVANLKGPAGENGQDGSIWLEGKGAPSKDVGKSGDLYLDNATGDVYLKSKEEGWKFVTNLQSSDKEKLSGWVLENGVWYFYDTKTGEKKTGWFNDGGTWYYLNKSGQMQTGWLQEGSKWYYLTSSGAMKTGWLQEGSKWYYLTSSGAMKTGWLQVESKWYYLTSSGAMKTGWLQEGSKWYYLTSSGAMKTGWLQVGSKWYYLTSSGAMKTGWLQEGSKWYYLNSSGAMQTGWATISGKRYYFNSNGVLK